jgi:signal transduction histidine kinase
MATNVETIQGNNQRDGRLEKRPKRGEASDAGRLASFIYHDLRHPLTAILAYSEFLAEYDLDRLQREDFHEEIRRAVSRMNDLISLLLEFSKRPENFRLEVADIAVTVKRAIQVVTVRPEFRRIAIRYEHEGLTEGRFDVGGLQQVITNIVLNACEVVSPDSGRVEIRSSGRQGHVEISISDNGSGIPMPIRHAVFQPFVSYGKSGGTGLGLAIVQKILHAHGGDIFLDDTGEKGTCFRLVLPFVGPRDDESLIPKSQQYPSQGYAKTVKHAAR